MASYVLVHGVLHGSRCGERIVGELRVRGDQLTPATNGGSAERANLADRYERRSGYRVVADNAAHPSVAWSGFCLTRPGEGSGL
jgi:hypothetical protein